MSRTDINGRDVQQMLAIARHQDTDDGGHPLPWELLHDLTNLVDCDLLSVSGQDTPRWEFFGDQELPALGWSGTPSTEWSVEQTAAYDAAYRRHYLNSVCSYPSRTGDIVSVIRVSDLQTESEHHNSGMYLEYLRPIGCEHEIMVCLDAGAPQRTLRLLFARGPGRDFSDRDVAILTLLRPHLQAAYLAAQRREHRVAPLTVRQQEILQHVAAGYTNAQIARRLDLSSATVRKHLENIFARLEVTSRTAAVTRADALI